MGKRNNNLSKEGIQDVYLELISQFRMKKIDSSPLIKRLRELKAKDRKRDKLITAMELLRDVIKDVEDFQDKYGMSTNLYYTIKEFLDE